MGLLMNIRWSLTLGASVAVIAPVTAHATIYLSTEQAQQVIFPGAPMTRLNLMLTESQIKAIEARSDTRVRSPELKVWRTNAGDLFIVDEVLGKHELITYAVGLTAAGAVRQIEIMEYKETYGYEVRNADWRGQFVGKTAASPLKLEQDIKNVSGATLSSKHITEGVRRVLATYEIVLKKP
jgi:hypothetical protein